MLRGQGLWHQKVFSMLRCQEVLRTGGMRQAMLLQASLQDMACLIPRRAEGALDTATHESPWPTKHLLASTPITYAISISSGKQEPHYVSA